MEKQIETIKQYFKAENNTDTEGVVSLFTDDATVFNVNRPPVSGKNGLQEFCEDFYRRTSARDFTIISITASPDVIMAEWQAKITFRAGAQIGPYQLAQNFTVDLRGVNKFEFAANTNLIRCLRIYHETTTVAQLAEKHALKIS